MSEINALLERIAADEDFRGKVSALVTRRLTPEQGVAAVRELGYHITKDDWTANTTARKPGGRRAAELSESELESVAGGVNAQEECWFHDASNGYLIDLGTIVDGRLPCEQSSCFQLLGLIQCACHGTDRCVGKMHTVELDYSKQQYVGVSLTPKNQYRHERHGSMKGHKIP